MPSGFDLNLFEYFANIKRQIQLQSLVLGGTAGSGGGIGGPPGGFSGYLPQTKVAYDLTEAANSGFVEPGAVTPSGVVVSGSLLDNLNHIRYRLTVVESATGQGVQIYQDDVLVASGVTIIDFHGASVVDVGGGEVEVTTSGGGAGSSTFLGLTDTPSSYSGQSGKVPAVNGAENGLEFVVVSGAGGDTYKSKVSSNDTTENYLENKIVAGSNVSISVLNEGGNEQLQVTASGGGSGASLGIWMPMVAPSTPHADDDEFSDASLDGDWTELDPGSDFTITEPAWGLAIEDTTQNSQTIGGIFKACSFSGGIMTVITKVNINNRQSGGIKAGLMFGEDLTNNPTTSNILLVNLVLDGAGAGIQAEEWTAYDGGVATSFINQNWGFEPHASLFIRVRWLSTTTFQVDMSTDGYSFFQKDGTFTCGFSPAEYGLGLRHEGAWQAGATFSFFRRTNDSSIIAPVYGRRLAAIS